MTMTTRHERAWQVPADNGVDYGVLVESGPPERPYWWLLCPATATLYIDDNPDLTDCCDGDACDWDDVHRSADRLRRELVAGSRGMWSP